MATVQLPRAFWVQSALALISAALAVLTLVNHAWFEALGLDPDQGSGVAEWLVVTVFALSAAVTAGLAGATWRRARTT